MMELILDDERQFLVRLLKRCMAYKSNGDSVRLARSLQAKIDGDDKVLVVRLKCDKVIPTE